MIEVPHLYRGEVFRNIKIFNDRVEFRTRNETITLSREELPCLKNDNEPCRVDKCEYFIKCEEFDNCVINVNRCMTLDEIGKLFGVSREMIRQDEERALKKAYKILKRVCGYKSFERPSLSQFLPDPPLGRNESNEEIRVKFVKKRIYRLHGNK